MKKYTSYFLSLLYVLFLSSCQNGSSILQWEELSFEAKPWTRWWWQGSAVTKDGISLELEAIKANGFGGLEITPIYGILGEEESFIDFLSPEWMDMLEHTLEEAQRLGLGIDMATGTGWPFGGPWVNDEQASKYLAYQVYDLSEGERIKDEISYVQDGFVRAINNKTLKLSRSGVALSNVEDMKAKANEPGNLQLSDVKMPVEDNEDLQSMAIDQVRFTRKLPLISLMAYSEEGQKLDLLDKLTDQETLDWVAPAGSWKIYAMYQGWHGKMVERAAPGGEGKVIDHFSTPAIQEYLKTFDEAFEGRQIAGLRAFFNDSYEVDDARGQANWTPTLLEAFKNKKGYDLQEYWPELLADSLDETGRRVLSDYRETISDLLLETFTTEWGKWARAQGKINRNQAHGSPANILDLYAASDIPETEGTDLVRAKFATSAGHVAGKKLISAEAATWLNEHFRSNLFDLKENLDRYFVSGVNHVVYHGTCYSPEDEPWPGRLFYAAIHANDRNPLWQDLGALNTYVGRVQSYLQKGQIDHDILLYLPAYDRYATQQRELLDHFHGHGPSLEGTPFEHTARELLAKGYAFDYVSDNQILGLSMNHGSIQTGGTKYQTVLIPQTEFMPYKTFERLIKMAEQGARMIFMDGLPNSVPGLGSLKERQTRMDSLKSVLEEAEWKENILIGNQLENLLDAAGIERESLVDNGLQFSRKTIGNDQLYFIANNRDQSLEGWINLARSKKNISILDPMTGKIGSAEIRESSEKGMEVHLQMQKGQSLILLCSDQAVAPEPWNYIHETEDHMLLDTNWSISNVIGGPYTIDSKAGIPLGSWTEWGNDTMKAFSGFAVYSCFFDGEEGDWLLDLGQVYESARVEVNGTHIGTLIGPEFKIMIPSDLIQEENILWIEVSNLMANRIIDMEKRGLYWKKFYNINFPPRLRENMGPLGIFDASDWEPLPSGLVGPVKLIRVE